MENNRFESLKNYPAPALPRSIFAGEWTGGHIQGIAVDTERKYIYYSFTTVLVKADLDGNVVGTVEGGFGAEDGDGFGGQGEGGAGEETAPS